MNRAPSSFIQRKLDRINVLIDAVDESRSMDAPEWVKFNRTTSALCEIRVLIQEATSLNATDSAPIGGREIDTSVGE